MCCRWRHENGRGGEVSSKCGVGKENARMVEESLRYWSVLGRRIHAARGSLRENVAGNGCGIDREVCLNFLQSSRQNFGKEAANVPNVHFRIDCSAFF